ncbi:membrane protein [Staphylococcus phage Biyabeda-mokiny_2]|nr:membrane protein [Staphylococcus phage Biyabeda-mokiny_1]UXE02749.1 membrane protein [Staphylococcus phage Biyabeda-mokiny_2]WJJ56981.1 membrane protein [Staphylococcus phage vB_SAP01]
MKLEDKVLERIDSLGGKLGDISQHAWEALVKYQIAYGIVDIIIGILVIALTVFLWKVFVNQHKKVNDIDRDDDYSLLFEDCEDLSGLGITYLVFTGIITFIAFIYLVWGIPQDILRIINPEVFAVKDLIEQAKGGN